MDYIFKEHFSHTLGIGYNVPFNFVKGNQHLLSAYSTDEYANDNIC